MKFPGAILAGAQARLLPPSIPFRFFAGAAFFHLIAWALLAGAYDQAAGFTGGPGPVLAALHALTIGVMLSAAIGASFQMLPIATGQALMALWPCRLASWLLYPGLVIQLYGFYASEHIAMLAGAGLVSIAIIIFFILIGDVYRRASDMALLTFHGWGAIASLAIVAALGLLLIVNMEYGIFSGHSAIALVHMIIAGFGFMGLLVMGYSQILVPMFALSPAPPQKRGVVVLLLAASAIIVSAISALTDFPALMFAGIAAGLLAAVIHIMSMMTALASGMRKNLGLSFIMVRISWGLFLLSLLAGAMAAAGWLGPNGPALSGFIIFYGWLLTFLLGILQRILPFLASMNASKSDQASARPSEMCNENFVKIHAICHLSALVVVGAGIVLDRNEIILTGALAGLAGAILFFIFTMDVIRRMRAYSKERAA